MLSNTQGLGKSRLSIIAFCWMLKTGTLNLSLTVLVVDGYCREAVSPVKEALVHTSFCFVQARQQQWRRMARQIPFFRFTAHQPSHDYSCLSLYGSRLARCCCGTRHFPEAVPINQHKSPSLAKKIENRCTHFPINSFKKPWINRCFF